MGDFFYLYTTLKIKTYETMNFKLGMWGVVGLTFVYIYIMNFYFDYMINRNVDETLQFGMTFLALVYTAFQIKLIIKEITNLFNKKEEEK